ncbi:DUF2087 domain-containing protein [Brevibacillus humidisoli]|uniref:DUF2087 domain-containing protein n=1 Tax=Brevibacillus humidisoli TaxID=2895522 RepID=UPI001E3C9D5D|nr:DUF2087 domain-containing protein [Brevibacillus humidisoli]UFJ41023.1 DUF2087 domain-containing protein [Brevibacillus humidisoli]
MSDLSAMFWNASVEEIVRGYMYDESVESYCCLICGERFTKGVIYPFEGGLYEAEKYTQVHISKEHDSMFDYLISLDKKFIGLTDHQKTIIHYFYQGLNDTEIVKQLGGGSKSTIRNHRFALREKAKQAKLFLAIMELVEKKAAGQEPFIEIPRTTPMADERFAMTEGERAEILHAYFKEGLDGPLSEFPKKEKRKVAILTHIIHRFEQNKTYSEQEVNTILGEVYHDYVTLRRYLIEYGLLDRTADGSKYWMKV